VNKNRIIALSILAAGIIFSLLPSKTSSHPSKFVRSQNPIAGSYIVVLNDALPRRSNPGNSDVSLDASSRSLALAATYGGTIHQIYDEALKGYAVEMTETDAQALSEDARVKYVEEDSVMTATGDQFGAPWGLDRSDQRDLPLNGDYNFTRSGVGVNAYVIDTGIYTSHSQFGGRAAASYDAFGGSGQDCNGHGTHVAGTIGSTTYGVAKNVYLRAVRVLDCNGSGATSGIIAGMNWVQTNATKPAVANMSLGGGYSSSLNTAATNLANSGVFLAVAAGNENQAACNVSPASASGTLTVAATGSNDARASYSNYGGCVDVYAPGSSITSTWLNGGTNTISGTSMASPHAAGVAALYKATYGDAASSTIVSWIINNSTANVVSGNPSGTPNRLLYKSTL